MRVPWVIEMTQADPFSWKFSWRCAYCGVLSSERTEVKTIFSAADHVLTDHMPLTWLHYGDINDDLYSSVIAPYVFAPDVA